MELPLEEGLVPKTKNKKTKNHFRLEKKTKQHFQVSNTRLRGIIIEFKESHRA